MDSKSGHPETTGADCGSNADKADVGEEKEDFLGGGKVVAPVHVEPEDAGEAVCSTLGSCPYDNEGRGRGAYKKTN